MENENKNPTEMKPHKMILWTNRNCMVFDEDGKQLPKYQEAIDCFSVNKKLAKECCNLAKEFKLGQWRGWIHQISKEEMMSLLGLTKKP